MENFEILKDKFDYLKTAFVFVALAIPPWGRISCDFCSQNRNKNYRYTPIEMAFTDDLSSEIDSILAKQWAIRDGIVVPENDTVALADGAVKINATMLYADLVDSTAIAMYDRRVAARLFKAFLTSCSKIINERNGYIRSFDGDRVMGVFVGGQKNTNAAQAALNINYVFLKIIKPKLEAKYKAFSDETYKLAHCVGVDTSEVLVIRAGIRDNNDLVWVGSAPNVAAKLSGIRTRPTTLGSQKVSTAPCSTQVK